MVTTVVHAPTKLDVACGQNLQPGYTGIDLYADTADIKHDLFNFPWPIKSNTVKDLVCNHFVEHIPHFRPDWDKDGWWLFFDEVYRILKKGAVASFVHPYVKSDRAFWDPTHERFIADTTWLYLNEDWRKIQGLDHYPTKANFDIVTINGLGVADDIVNRNEEAQGYARQHYWNVIADLQVTLKKL